jgi:hypothetical protein
VVLSGYTTNGCYHKERFEDQVKNCNGKIEKKLCLEEQSIPFIPHLFKNQVYSFLLSYNRKKEYQVIRNYITYDFETVMRKKNVKITKKQPVMLNNYPCLFHIM